MKIRDLTTSRLRHSVAEAGAGEPLLLLHGFTGAKEDFADFLDGFADRGWHVVAPDHRGHGASDQPDDEAAYSLQIMADDMFAVADEMGWERFDLLGHSMGGMVAQVMVLQAPERVRSLVLMDTSPGPIEGHDPALVQLAIDTIRRDGIDGWIELTAQVEVARSEAAERVRTERAGYIEFGERKLRSCAPAMYAAMARDLTDAADRAEDLTRLAIRTLVVVGDQDADFIEPSARLAAAIPGAEHEVIVDAAHSPQFENPDRWWKVVSRFFEAGRPHEDIADDGTSEVPSSAADDPVEPAGDVAGVVL